MNEHSCLLLGDEFIILLLLELHLDNNFRKELLHVDQRTSRTKDYITMIKEVLHWISTLLSRKELFILLLVLGTSIILCFS